MKWNILKLHLKKTRHSNKLCTAEAFTPLGASRIRLRLRKSQLMPSWRIPMHHFQARRPSRHSPLMLFQRFQKSSSSIKLCQTNCLRILVRSMSDLKHVRQTSSGSICNTCSTSRLCDAWIIIFQSEQNTTFGLVLQEVRRRSESLKFHFRCK